MASGTLDVDSAPIEVHAFACNEVRLLIACLAYQMMHIARRVFAKATGTWRSQCERVLRAGARLVCQSASNIEQELSPAPGSARSVTGAAYGCGHEHCYRASTCRWSARSSRTAPRGQTQAPCCPRSPRAPSVSSLACEDGSACPSPASNVPQNRSCHEEGRTPGRKCDQPGWNR